MYKKWHSVIYFAIALFAFYHVGNRLITFEYWNQLSTSFIHPNWLLFLTLQLLLFCVNIYLEAGKWQFLLRPFLKTSFTDSVKMVFTGFMAGSISPMKTGEPAGRVIFLKSEVRPTAVLASLYGSYLNTAVLLIIGLLLFPIVLSEELIQLPASLKFTSHYYILFATGGFLLSYFIVTYILKKIKRKVRGSRWMIQESFFQNLKVKNTYLLILFTTSRLFIYNVQLYIWFLFFNVTLPIHSFLIVSPLYFVAITFIPGMFLIDLGIRGSLAVFIFSMLTNNVMVIISVIFSLWIVNVAIPTFLGSLLIIRYKNLKKG